MAVPKGFKTNINIKNGKIGPEKRQEILDDIADNGTFLPRGVLEEDMDQAFIEFIDKDERMALSLDGKKVPVIFLTIQRWSEFTRTWQFSDKYKDIELPFITILRKPDIQQGDNQAGLWNIPGNQTYTYYKVPTNDGIRLGVDLYKVPQPTSVDIVYEVRIFTNRMKDLNKLNRKMQRAFQSRQCYITPKGHPMPLFLETIGDESNIDDFEKRRFYVQMFEIKLKGYILDEEDFEVIPTINRTMLLVETEVNEDLNNNKIVFDPYVRLNSVTYTFAFKPASENSFSFLAKYDVQFTQLTNITNITRITISVNNTVVFDGTELTTPLIFYANETITIRIYKGYYNEGSFKLIGNTI